MTDFDLASIGLDVLFKGKNFARLMGGFGVALKISLLAVAVSIPSGILLGVLMTWENKAVRFLLRVYLEFIRIMPQLVLLFIVFWVHEGNEASCQRRNGLHYRLFPVGDSRNG